MRSWKKMKSRNVCYKKGTLIPFQVIYYKVPRKFLLKHYHKQELIFKDRAKIQRIKRDLERKKSNIEHVISIIDTILRDTSGSGFDYSFPT